MPRVRYQFINNANAHWTDFIVNNSCDSTVREKMEEEVREKQLSFTHGPASLKKLSSSFFNNFLITQSLFFGQIKKTKPPDPIPPPMYAVCKRRVTPFFRFPQWIIYKILSPEQPEHINRHSAFLFCFPLFDSLPIVGNIFVCLPSFFYYDYGSSSSPLQRARSQCFSGYATYNPC